MTPLRVVLTASAFALAGLAGCGGGDDATPTGASTSTAAPPAPAPAATGTKVKVADSDFGEILFDGSDQAIYMFDAEKTPASECYGACAEAWPPVLTKGAPAAGSGADAAKLGTTKRKDGADQVTYAGNPLYHYHGDPPGQVLCQNVDEFGGLWLVVKPSGAPVTSG
jgi:predicted lipoprotein with Yx(FWY)xxD motif